MSAIHLCNILDVTQLKILQLEFSEYSKTSKTRTSTFRNTRWIQRIGPVHDIFCSLSITAYEYVLGAWRRFSLTRQKLMFDRKQY